MTCLLIEFSGVIITVIKIDGSTIKKNGLTQAEVIGSEELTIFLNILLSFEELALRNT